MNTLLLSHSEYKSAQYHVNVSSLSELLNFGSFSIPCSLSPKMSFPHLSPVSNFWALVYQLDLWKHYRTVQKLQRKNHITRYLDSINFHINFLITMENLAHFTAEQQPAHSIITQAVCWIWLIFLHLGKKPSRALSLENRSTLTLINKMFCSLTQYLQLNGWLISQVNCSI